MWGSNASPQNPDAQCASCTPTDGAPQLWGRDNGGALSIIPGSGRWGLRGAPKPGFPFPAKANVSLLPAPRLLRNRDTQRCPQALTLPAREMASGRSQLRQICQVGAQCSADTYLGSLPESRRPSCWGSCTAVAGKAAARLVPLRTCGRRASGRFVSPQRSGSSRARRPRAEKPELVAEASGAPWRLLGAERSHPGA